MNRRRVSVLSMLVAPLLLMTGLVVSPAQASATNIVSIPSELDACKGVAQNVGLTKHEGGFDAGVYNTFGKSYPVILIHGLNGKNKGQWGDLDESTDLAARIDSISNAVVATEFQYDSHLTVPSRSFANAIDCLATISQGNGGPGKVIIVGYSEGSATAHDASVRMSADGKRAIQNEIGQAVTIADARIVYGWLPVFWAPDFPSNITVHSIGGNVINVAEASNGSYTHEQVTHSDGLVHTSDATKQSTDDAGGGTHVTSCFRVYPGYDEWRRRYTGTPSSPTCEHGNLLRNSEETQWDIVDAITAFVNAHCNNSNPGDNSVNQVAAAAVVPMASKTSPAPTPSSTDTPGAPGGDPTGTPGVPGGDPTSTPSPPPITGCTA